MEYIVVDIETTGTKFDDPSFSIVEIGICLVYDINKYKKLMSCIVKEPQFSEKDKNAWIFKNSKLRYEQVKNAPLFNNIKHRIQCIFDSYYATSYNINFDFSFLESRGIRISHKLPCLMEMTSHLLKIPYADPTGKSSYKWISFEKAYNMFVNAYIKEGISPQLLSVMQHMFYNEKHRAYDDAEHEAIYSQALYEKLNKMKPEDLDEIHKEFLDIIKKT